MEALVQNQQNKPVGGAPPRDKHGEFLKGHPPVFTHAVDPLEADDWLGAVKKQLNIAQCDDQQRCCSRLDNFREKLRTGGSHMSMDIPLMPLLSPGRSLERVSDPTTYLRD
jgi:hypothetical protein